MGGPVHHLILAHRQTVHTLFTPFLERFQWAAVHSGQSEWLGHSELPGAKGANACPAKADDKVCGHAGSNDANSCSGCVEFRSPVCRDA